MPDLGAARASVDKQSMRGFLAMVERDYPDELVRISQPVRRELDITATVFELERAGRSPVVVFEAEHFPAGNACARPRARDASKDKIRSEFC
jgi:hypothetical protein